MTYLEEMAMGDAPTRRRLLLQLQQQLPREMQQLKQFLQARQWLKARGQLHLLQSTLQFAGCRLMEEARTQLQDCLHREPVNAREARALLQDMQAREVEVMHELSTVLRAQEK